MILIIGYLSGKFWDINLKIRLGCRIIMADKKVTSILLIQTKKGVISIEMRILLNG